MEIANIKTNYDEEYVIVYKQVTYENSEGVSQIISNCFISGLNIFELFAIIIFNDCLEPIMLVYRDDLPEEQETIFLTIVDQHIIPRVKLSEFTDNKYQHITNKFRESLLLTTRRSFQK